MSKLMKRIELDEDCLQVDSNVARIIKKVYFLLLKVAKQLYT